MWLPSRVSVLALAIGGTLTAADWPRFRGPNGTGVGDPDAPVKWTKDDIAWKTPIPGLGHSSPIVVAGKVFLQSSTADGKKRLLVAVDAGTGKVAWTAGIDADKAELRHPKASLAASTPAADADRVYACFWTGKAVEVHAFDHAGKPQWKAPLGDFEAEHGAGMSPVVFAGKVYVNYDQDGTAALVALDAGTGEKKWSASRKAHRACPTTPLIRTLADGKSELVVTSTTGVGGYDPDTGNTNWSWAIEWPAGKKNLRAVASPVVAGNFVIAACGEGTITGRRAIAVVPGRTPKAAWEKTKDTSYVPTPVVKGDHLYWIRDDGFAVCAAIKTGDPVWTERVFNKPVSASPILVGDTVLAIAEDGKAVAFKATPDGLDTVGESPIGEAVFATPAAANGKLYVRGGEHLFCVSKKK